MPQARFSLLGATLLALASLTTVSVYADLPRNNPVSGGVAVIPLTLPLTEKPEVRFGERKVHVAKDADGWKAYVGLPCDILPGRYIVMVSDSDQARLSIEWSVMPHPPPHLQTRQRNRQWQPNSQNRIITLPEQLQRHSVMNSNMPHQVDTNYGLTEVYSADFKFQAPVESTLTIDYGQLQVKDTFQCHNYLSFFVPADKLAFAPAKGFITDIESHEHQHIVTVAHTETVVSILGNLTDLLVEVGQTVNRGDRLGAVATVDDSPIGRLDWAIALNGYLVDPLQFSAVP